MQDLHVTTSAEDVQQLTKHTACQAGLAGTNMDKAHEWQHQKPYTTPDLLWWCWRA